MTKNKILTPSGIEIYIEGDPISTDNPIPNTPIAGPNSDFNLEIGKGNIAGYGFVFLTGENANVGTEETLIRDIGGTGDYPWPLTAAQWFLKSTSDDDTDGGSGARSVFATFLEADFTEVFEIKILSGQTSVQFVTEAFRINGISVFTAGADFKNDGRIDVTTLTAGAGDILGSITIGEGQMRQAIVTIPAGETWFPLNFYISSGKSDDVDLKAVAYSPGTVPDRIRSAFSKSFVFESAFPLINVVRVPFTSGNDLQVVGTKSEGSSSGRMGNITEFETVILENF